MPTETIFYLKCFLKRRISIVSNLFGSSIHNCTDCSLGNTCQSRSHALATYSNFQNYRQCPSVPNQPTQSRWLTHNSAFTFDHSISIGFISGLYGGRYRSSMPAA